MTTGVLEEALDRRAENRVTRKPKGIKLTIDDRDIRWFHFLHRHGGRLPTSYLHDYTKHTHRNKTWSQNRLRDLFHDSKHLDRNWRQLETIDPRYNEVIHELNSKSLGVLEEEGLFSPHVPKMSGAYKHQVMLSCVSASFELNARDNEEAIGFAPQHESVDHTNAFLDERQREEVRPDGIVVVKNKKNGRQSMLFFEIDRSTEQSHDTRASRRKARQTIEGKVQHYKKLIGKGLYKKEYGFTGGAFLLFITTGEGRCNTFLDIVEKEVGDCPYMMATAIPEFGRQFHPPKKLDMLGRTYLRNYVSNFNFLKKLDTPS